ncbi:hypothetical protein Skr01_75410 [Sphaerisporangium krabiense]|uniref:Uncharacterized protein n=1 Tax=Sphaerisporangium krabiense TaxID=763782 RepID=A0A7W9DPL1_9ACTN|nr:hypothetical protein [Sphaerisporangium krabiense]MBB5626139.1 hypothetical protein [Sphaerisporangium krabiense]GII67456.1 hypothetical protein Skr01_75410 [Sphaerisporangium krabiense]
MNAEGRSRGEPRWGAWLCVLVGVITVAHLWTHVTAPHQHGLQLGAPVVDSCPDNPPHDHHDESAHPEVFLPPAWGCAVPAQAPAVLVVPAVTPAPVSAAPRERPGRAPPRCHRERAALTHTLEICRR